MKFPEKLYHYRISSNSLSQKSQKKTIEEMRILSVHFLEREFSAGTNTNLLFIGTKQKCEIYQQLLVKQNKILNYNYMYVSSHENLLKKREKFKNIDVIIILDGIRNKFAIIDNLREKGFLLNQNLYNFI